MSSFSFGNVSFEVIVKHIEGSASVRAKKEIDLWLESDPNNKILYNRIKEVWISDKEDIRSLKKEVVIKDLTSVLTRIQESEDEKVKKPVHIFKNRWWLRVAAIIVVIISITLSYIVGKGSEQNQIRYTEKYAQIEVPRGQRSQITLPDGSSVWINADSRIRFSNLFGNETRDIWLEGEAYFEVAKDNSIPFYVHAGDLIVKVHGTSFNVKAYPEEDLIETILIEGSLSIARETDNTEALDEIYLFPDNKISFSKKESAFMTKDIIDAKSFVTWREGKLTFENETFENIIVELDRLYDIRIILDDTDQTLQKTRYTGVLKNISIEQALNAIQRSMPIDYSIHEDTVLISKKLN